jgi:hypothetical protein
LSSSSSSSSAAAAAAAAAAGSPSPPSFSRVSATRPGIGYQRISDCLVFPSAQRSSYPPRAIIHFIGGAFIGAVPEATYR